MSASTPDHWLEVTDAAERDLDSVLELATAASVFTYNSVRNSGADRVGFLRSEFISIKTWTRQGKYRILVARDKELDKIVGYLWLNLYSQDDLGRRQTWAEDLGALPEYSGRGVGDALLDHAAKVTAELGIDYMGAEISALNPARDAALRGRFHLEAYKLVRACTPEAEAQVALQAQLRESKARREARRKNRE